MISIFWFSKNTLKKCNIYFVLVELAMIMDRLYGGVCYAGNIMQQNLTPFVQLNYCPFSF